MAGKTARKPRAGQARLNLSPAATRQTERAHDRGELHRRCVRAVFDIVQADCRLRNGDPAGARRWEDLDAQDQTMWRMEVGDVLAGSVSRWASGPGETAKGKIARGELDYFEFLCRSVGDLLGIPMRHPSERVPDITLDMCTCVPDDDYLPTGPLCDVCRDHVFVFPDCCQTHLEMRDKPDLRFWEVRAYKRDPLRFPDSDHPDR